MHADDCGRLTELGGEAHRTCRLIASWCVCRFSWNRQLPDNAPQTITAMLRARGETFRELHRTCPPRSDVVFYKMGLLETKFQENIYLNNPFMHWVWA